MEDLDLGDLPKVGAFVGRGLGQREGIRIRAADDGFCRLGELGLGGHVERIITRSADEVGSVAA